TGNMGVFSESYTRVMDYNTAYEPPAPFSFHLVSDQLLIEEGSDLSLEVRTAGKSTPEEVTIHYNEEVYYMKTAQNSVFTFDFQGIKDDFNFYLKGNGVTSQTYEVRVVKVPTVIDFEMSVDYPNYLNKPGEVIKGTGNITIPEGTRVTWNLLTRTTDEVMFFSVDSLYTFEEDGNSFSFSQSLFA